MAPVSRLGYGLRMYSCASGLTFVALLLLLHPPCRPPILSGSGSRATSPVPHANSPMPGRHAADMLVELSTASTGKLYAQIRAGAPFDVFLAADEGRPKRLKRRRPRNPEPRCTRWVAWPSCRPNHRSQARTVGRPSSLRRQPTVAVANPATAPYGRAALDWLEAQATSLELRLVKGDNVGQAMSFRRERQRSLRHRCRIAARGECGTTWPGCITETARGQLSARAPGSRAHAPRRARSRQFL